MKSFKSIAFVFVLLAAFLCAAPGWSQTANTGLVFGTVTDPAGAVVPDAKVQLNNTDTNETKEAMTNAAGQYTFPGVTPGKYKVTITKAGFATFVVANLVVDVNKSYPVDVKMEIRSSSEVVEVSAGAEAELQKVDAVVGGVVGGEMLTRLPTLNRDATELLTLQPGSTPYDDSTGFGNGGGTVAGARSDQNTISLDGIDITDNVITGGANESPIIPVGVDAVDEFRVGVTNPNATFGRSAGGQITLISHSGTNNYHGTAYWFHQNDNLNANTWDLNHTPDGNGNKFTKKPEQKDNRVGLSFGGPIRRDKTFIFGNYEVRRFPQALSFTRLVPSATLKQGILQFRDCSQGFDSSGNCTGGTVQPYNLATAANCGSDSQGQPLNQACDPRGLGISPTVQALWNLMPTGNDNTVPGADGLNILGFRGTVPASLKSDGVGVKLDHNFTDKVHFFGRYSYARSLSPNGFQIDLRGTPSTPSGSQLRGDSIISGLDWQLRPNLLNSFRGGWVRSRQDFSVTRPSTSAAQLALQGTASSASQTGFISLAPGLATGSGFLDTIVDVDTQRARHQAIYDSNKQYSDFLTWTKGKHTIVGGTNMRWLPTIHDRDDKVIGSVNSLVAALDGDHNFTIPGANRLAACAPLVPASGGNPAIPAVTNNCIQSSDVFRWDRLYAASLGLIDNVGILTASDGKLNPLPFGTTLVARTTLRSYDFFWQDTWRMTPSLTITYGLSYGWQTTPQERDGKQALMVDNSNGNKILTAKDYLGAKEAAAANGDFYDHNIGYMPVRSSGRSNVFNVDYGDFAPRFSIAWNPSFKSSFLGRVFADRKTVVRGGYGISYDRINTVGSVIIPMLGVGFAQTLTVAAPACNANGAGSGGPGCGVNGTPGGSIFRVGVDGSIPTPAPLTKQSIPVVPSGPLAETLSFADDPDFKVGRNHMVDFTIQREMRGNMLLEVGYIGRYARDLLNNVNFNSSPLMFKDKVSGQTFAQAYDALSAQVRAGSAITTQPWFENLFPNYCQSFLGAPISTSTQCVAALFKGDFTSFNVSDLFLNMDLFRDGRLICSSFGLPQGCLPQLPTFNDVTLLDMFVRTHRDFSNYHAAFVALHNRGWHGIQFDLNYTYSKSLDQIGTVQNSASYFASSFNPAYEYGPSFFDRPHIFNGTYSYDLPFGHGHLLGSSSHEWFNKIIGGWYTAGVVRIASGQPLTVVEGLSGGSLGGGEIFGVAQAAIPTVNPSSLGAGVHENVCSSGGVGSTGDGSNCGSGDAGTGINYFANPSAAIKDFRPILLASDGRTGRSRPMRGFGIRSFDMRIGKETKFREKYGFEISADMFNAFNHPIFLNPNLDLTNLPTFGVVSSTLIPANRTSSSRWIQLGLRINF
ncbi:MAG TPA: carboxypeptidase-like regulatory domain-containing protein [Candidatus Acidoferrum sp.]|nr:carboxypeptidase-like regulatory domain-containing protein [Candidatus Acidoferrum sp.]